MESQHVLAGRYALVSHLARGGMADVYVAEDRRLGRRVAVKVLHGQLATSEAFVERFRREAQAAANLTHPNIVGIYDWGHDSERDLYFMVMELVKGRNLRQILKSEGTLLPQRVAEIASDSASALAAAHRAGLVHRDIKPANVLLTGDGNVKVTDFGIARVWDDSEQLTRTGAVIGTATYFSPEQAQGIPADARSDLYSLGIVMYELLTGQPPFSGESPVAVAYQHVQEHAPAPSRLNPRVPPELDVIVMRALAKDPAQRYQSADDMRDDLEGFLAGTPPAAVHESDAATRLMAAAPGPGPTPGPGARTPRPDYSAESYAEPTRISTSTWVIGIMVATALVGLALILLIRILSSSGTGELVVVPDVKMSTVENATAQLEEADFMVETADVPDSEVPVGLAAGTDPAAGTEVERGSAVKLLVSTGASTVTVPNLLGLTLDQARSIILSAGLDLGDIDFEASSVIPIDTIISQDPPPGGTVDAGTPISLMVSAGTDAITMPDVVGKSQADAQFQLIEAGFTSEQITVEERASNDVLEGFVIETIPAVGEQVSATGSVTLVVSSGSEPVEVPDVIGKTAAEATDMLSALGFLVELGDAVELPFGDENDGKVVEQSPAAGQDLAPGEVVTLRVGTSGDPVVVPNLLDSDAPLSFAEAKQVLEDLGLNIEQVADVEVEFGSLFEGKVAEQSPPPGTEIAAGATVQVGLGKAPAGVDVPDVVTAETNEAAAKLAIEAAGLVFARNPVDAVNDPGDPKPGLAAGQDPAAGSVVAPNSTVTVTFYETQSTVPNVIGRIWRNAQSDLAAAGLNWADGGPCKPADPTLENQVAWQSSDPGSPLDPGATVTIRRGVLSAVEACPA